jgi:hypothetical protein
MPKSYGLNIEKKLSKLAKVFFDIYMFILFFSYVLIVKIKFKVAREQGYKEGIQAYEENIE